MAKKFIVRERTAADLPELLQCVAKVYEEDEYPVGGPSTFHGLLTDDSLWMTWVFEQDGKIVGHVAIAHAEEDSDCTKLYRRYVSQQPQEFQKREIATLSRLFMEPSMRGHGLGKQLVRHAMAWAADNNIRLLLMVIEKDRNAVGLYQKYGWEKTGDTSYLEPATGKKWAASCWVAPVQMNDVDRG